MRRQVVTPGSVIKAAGLDMIDLMPLDWLWNGARADEDGKRTTGGESCLLSICNTWHCSTNRLFFEEQYYHKARDSARFCRPPSSSRAVDWRHMNLALFSANTEYNEDTRPYLLRPEYCPSSPIVHANPLRAEYCSISASKIQRCSSQERLFRQCPLSTLPFV